MKVLHRQQFVGAEFNPLVAGIDLTLWAVPIPARVERDGSMAALRTGIHMAT
jgi:hypothetical protein